MAKIIKGPGGLKLILDIKDSDTPATVELGKASATYDCATGTGCLMSGYSCLDVELSDAQLEFLSKHESEVAETFVAARAGMPEYND